MDDGNVTVTPLSVGLLEAQEGDGRDDRKDRRGFCESPSAPSGRQLRPPPMTVDSDGYLAAFALLVAATSAPWVEILFPLWVLLVSIEILRAGKRALSRPDAGT